MGHVLFLCTGNYYRSRYAESAFRHRAAAVGLGWTGDSRGLQVVPGRNPGSISGLVTAWLAADGIDPGPLREPRNVVEADLERSDRIILTCEREHRPLFAARFPRFLPQVASWDVEDIDRTPAPAAREQLDRWVGILIAQLRLQP